MSPSKPRLLLLGKVHQTDQDTWSEITQAADIIDSTASTRADLIVEAQSGRLDGVSVVYTTVNSAHATGRLDKELLEALPSSLKFICHGGLDYSHIDIAVCTSRRILVSNVPTASADAIADLSLWLLLGALRGLTGGNKQDHGDASAALGHDPRGKVLGIVGATPVARRLAVRANAALGMSVVYHTMERLDKEHEKDFGPGVKYAERLEDLFRQSDAISLHISAGSETHHPISTSQLELLRPSAVLINTSSPDLVDQPALAKALSSNKLAAAGLDIPSESLHQDLHGHPRALITPGVAARTFETQKAVENWALGNVRKALIESQLTSVIPEQRDLEIELAD